MEPNIPSQPTPPITPETQTPITQSIPPFPSSSSSKTKYVLLGLLILLIIAAVGGVTYYLGVVQQKPVVQKSNNVVAATTPSVTPIPSLTPISSSPSNPTQTPIPTTDPTLDWKTYTDKGGKYSIGYPTDFRVITPPIGATAINIVNTDNTFHLVIDSEPTNLDLYKYIDQKTWCTSINSTTGKPFEIDKENFLRFEKTPCGQTGSTDLYAIHNGIAYHLSMGTQQNYDTLLPELNQILATFKFTQ